MLLEYRIFTIQEGTLQPFKVQQTNQAVLCNLANCVQLNKPSTTQELLSVIKPWPHKFVLCAKLNDNPNGSLESTGSTACLWPLVQWQHTTDKFLSYTVRSSCWTVAVFLMITGNYPPPMALPAGQAPRLWWWLPEEAAFSLASPGQGLSMQLG